MTELEDREEQGGGEAGAQAREAFARTVLQSRPRLAFTAEDLVLGGRRRVRRRRLAAVVGSTASVAVVAVAATAFAGGGGRSGAVVVAPAASVTTTVTTSPSGNPSRPLTDDERTLAEKKLAAAVFAEVLGKLDPGMKHLTYTPAPHAAVAFAPNTGVCTEKLKVQVSYGFDAIWTADGKNPFPRPKDATSPFIQVDIQVYAPGLGGDQFAGTHDWGPITRTRLPDGSVVQTASAADGRRLQTVRTMGNGQEIVFSVIDDSVNGGGAWGAQSLPTNPFPFTAAQLSGIVSAVSLPLPFADGFQPRTTCVP